MKFDDIPSLVQSGTYEINMPLDCLDHAIKQYQDTYDLQLCPRFQRGHVWTEAQQIAYVEFFLRGGMTGRVVYFNKPDWGHFGRTTGYSDMVCVDGLQRLTALLKFVRGYLPAFGYKVALKDGPTVDGPWFEDRLRLARANDNLRININNLQTEADVLQWYLELNEGGTPHTKSELDKVRRMLKETK